MGIKAGTPGNIKRLKTKLKESSGGDRWFYRVQPDTELKVRFMVEPWEFTYFDQHSTGTGKDFKSFPCSDDNCVGCDEGADVYKVWVAPVVDVAESRVRVLQVPKSIVDELTRKADRQSTIRNRDWVIIREGSGRDNTKYYLEDESPKKRDLSIYEMPDIMAMLEAQLAEATGEDDEEEDEPPRRSRSSKKVSKSVKRTRSSGRSDDVWANVDDEEDDDDPPWDSSKTARRPLKKAAKKVSKTIKKSLRSAAPRKGLRR